MASDQIIPVSIGRFSTITRLSPRTLRVYDEKGLLVPKRDRFNNYRYYTADQIETGLTIKTLACVGFGCSEIGEILSCLQDIDSNRARMDELFRLRLEATREEIGRLKAVEAILQGKSVLEVISMSNSEPVIKEVPEVRVISKRGTGPIGKVVEQLMVEVMGQLFSPVNQRNQAGISGPPMLIYYTEMNPDQREAYHGGEIDLDNASVEVAIPVVGRLSVDPGFEVKTISGGRVVAVMHTGPYQEIGGAYGNAFRFIGARQLTVTGACREVYLNSPGEVAPAQLLTEVQIPIK